MKLDLFINRPVLSTVISIFIVLLASKTMKMEITVDNTGLLMNKSNFIDQQFWFALGGN